MEREGERSMFVVDRGRGLRQYAPRSPGFKGTNKLVRWLSGRKQRFAKAPYPKRVPRVRIPASPLLFPQLADHVQRDPTDMKSAYELAMERLEKKAPSIALTNEQKEQIAEVESSYRAKIAEKELFLKDQIRKAQGAGSMDEAASLEKQLSIEIRRLQEDCEEKKEKLRRSFAS